VSGVRCQEKKVSGVRCQEKRVSGVRCQVSGKRVQRFRVQACPGATGCGYEIVFTFYEPGFTSPHFDMPGLGQGFSVVCWVGVIIDL